MNGTRRHEQWPQIYIFKVLNISNIKVNLFKCLEPLKIAKTLLLLYVNLKLIHNFADD